jgi:RNA recognition motif-containing protein
MPAPKLTWWQKILKSVGLYKEPVRPPRPERRPDATEPKKTREPRRTKTRDARTENREDRTENREDRSEQQSDSRDSGESPRRGKRRDRNSGGPRGGDPSTVENRRVYVGNLSYDTTESDLEELFKGVGAVRRVEIVYNRTTHRSKGYGFIEMIDIDEAKRTVEVLHDQFFMGRQLTVSGAKSQDHETAENEEGANERQNNQLPPVAPINPAKEQVLDLIDEPQTEEPAAEVTTEEPHAEIPTEEFSPEADTAEETKEQPNA